MLRFVPRWMGRMARGLESEPELLVSSDQSPRGSVVASLHAWGPEALASPREAILPNDLAGAGAMSVLAVEESAGEYRPGDLVWLRQIAPDATAQAINRDVLVPRPGGRFCFGRLIDRQGTLVGVLPPGSEIGRAHV